MMDVEIDTVQIVSVCVCVEVMVLFSMYSKSSQMVRENEMPREALKRCWGLASAEKQILNFSA